MGFTPSFDATIWGTGILNLKHVAIVQEQSVFREYDVRAVRGPLTKRALEAAGYKVPNVFGDPAILIKNIYSPEHIEKKYDCSLIFHFRYAREVAGINCITTETKDFKYFVDEIVSSKKIISSSLHGIIFAETYGIPTVMLCENIEQEDVFKYYDWYYSTGRYNVKIADSIEEALEMEPMELPKNLDLLRKGLIESFPYDLWGLTD